MHVEVAWVVSCDNASGYAHHQAPSRIMNTTSTPFLDLDLDLDIDIDIDVDTDPGLDTDLEPVLDIDHDIDHADVGGAIVAMVTIAPTIIKMTAIIHLLIAAARSIDQLKQ